MVHLPAVKLSEIEQLETSVKDLGNFGGKLSDLSVFSPNAGKSGKNAGVNLRIQSEYRKIRTRNNSVCGHFSRSIAFHCRLFQYVFSIEFYV